MTGRPNKRARLSKEIAPTANRSKNLPPLSDIIASFNSKTVASLLLSAASDNPSVASAVESEHLRLISEQQKKVRDFDYLSKSVWKTVNVTYDKMSSRRQFDASGDAIEAILEDIHKIRDGCPSYASFGTKKSGLETLRKIGKSICLGHDEIGKQIRMKFQYDKTLERIMRDILKSMTNAERQQVAKSGGDPTFMEKVVELNKLAGQSSIFEDLPHVVLILESAHGKLSLQSESKPSDGKSEMDEEDDQENGYGDEFEEENESEYEGEDDYE